MNLIDLILNLSSSISKEIGHILHKEKKVKKIENKKIDNIYHLYGIVFDNNYEQRTHIKYNLINKRLEAASCSCDNYKENSIHMKNYICPHIVATIYKYYALVKIKNNEKAKDNSKISNNLSNASKQKLGILLKEEKINGKIKYYLELKLGKERAVTVDSLVNFLYSFNKADFSEEDNKILEYLIRKQKGSKSRIFNGRAFLIEAEELYDFLFLVEENKIISLTHDYMIYNSKIIKEDMPLVHNLKAKDNKIILSGQKKQLLPLNKERTVWLYDKNIYLPSQEQIKYYNIIFDKLEVKEKLVYSNTKENLQKLIFILKKISKKINYDENMISFIKTVNKPIIDLEKIEGKIYCSLEIPKINEKIDYKEKEKVEIILEGLSFRKEGEKYIFIGNDEAQYKFFKYGINKLKNIAFLKISNNLKEDYLLNNENIYSEIIRLKEEYIFRYSLDDIAYDEIGDIINSINRGESFYKTRKNRILDLEDPKVVEFFHSLSELNNFKTVYKNEIYADKFQLLHIGRRINEGRLPLIKGEELINKLMDKLKNKKEEYELPKKLKAKLRDYQVKGYNWLKQIEDLSLGGILADDMGLGKTIQTIALLLSSENKKSLVICPTAVIYNWKNEFTKFAPSLKIGLIHGSKSERDKLKEEYKEYDCILTSYGTLKNDFDFYKDKSFDFIIIDEAQNIKNKDSKTTEIVKKLNGTCKFALSGTPIENNLLELWSIFDFIMPGYLYNEEKFKAKFLRGKDENLKDLKNLISPFILRRVKEEVLEELPDKIEKEYYISMSQKQKQIYNSYMKEVKQKLKEDKDNKIVIFSYLTNLRQLCLDPSLLIEEYKEESPKIEAVIDLVKELKAQKRKMIIFSQFTKVLTKISNRLSREDYNYLYLDGAVSAKDRLRLVEEFNNGPVDVFLISLKAGGVGLNLTSASLVVHFDPWWNPAVEDQATDRAHRLGQKNVVEVIKLISKDTIEEKILALQNEKRELINTIIEEDNLKGDILNKISKEELLELFN